MRRPLKSAAWVLVVVGMLCSGLDTEAVAGGQPTTGVEATQTAEGVNITVRAEGSGDAKSVATGGSGSVTCQLFPIPSIEIPHEVVSTPVTDPEVGFPYTIICTNLDGAEVRNELTTYQPTEPAEPAITAGTLAALARADLPLVHPAPKFSPRNGVPQITGLRTWMWIDPDDWQPRSATAAIPGLSATVTATPQRMEWHMGQGQGTRSSATGQAPSTTSTSDPKYQSSDCTHLYQDRDDYDDTSRTRLVDHLDRHQRRIRHHGRHQPQHHLSR